MVGAGTLCPTTYVSLPNTQVMVRVAMELLEPITELLELKELLDLKELLELRELLDLKELLELLLELLELLLVAVTFTVPQGAFRIVTEPQVAVTLIV